MLEQNWKKYIQEHQPKQFHCHNQNMGFLTEWTRTLQRIGIRMKKWWWFQFVWMVDVVLQGAWVLYPITKDEGVESLPLLAFPRHVVNAIFLKYSKEGRLPSSHLGIRNIPSHICYLSNFATQNITRCTPPRLKLTLPWWGSFPPRTFYPSASRRRAQLSVAANVVKPTDHKNVRYWFTIY